MANSKTLVGHASCTFKRVHEEDLESCDRGRDQSFARKDVRVIRLVSLPLRRARLSVRRSATREDGVIRWWSDNDRARANDWRPRRVARESARQQIGSLT